MTPGARIVVVKGANLGRSAPICAAILALAVIIACGGNGSGEPSLPAATAQPTAARIDTFELTSYSGFEQQSDLHGGGAYITKEDITVRAHVAHITRLDVVASQCGNCTAVRASVMPDEEGNAEVTLHLPETGRVYIVAGYGAISSDYPLSTGGLVNSAGEPVISSDTFAVKAIP